MKKSNNYLISLKYLIYLTICVFISYVVGCHAPYVSEQVNKNIQKGMPVNKVIEIATSYPVKQLYCTWILEGIEAALSKKNECNIPDSIEFPTESSKPVRLEILYMGPVFQHNNFSVMLASNGTVSEVSETQHWD